MRRNDRPKIRLAKGAIKTNIEPLIIIQFDSIEETLSEELLHQLKKLCSTDRNSLNKEIQESEDILSEDQFVSYQAIATCIQNPKQCFISLKLQDNDIGEIDYVIQKNLYDNICNFLKKNNRESQHQEWINQTKNYLINKFNSLPRQQVIYPDYKLAASRAGFLAKDAIKMILALALLFQLYRLHTLYNSPNISDAGKRELLPAYLSIALISFFIGDMLSLQEARNNFQGMRSALRKGVFEREIQAQAPVNDADSSPESIVQKPMH